YDEALEASWRQYGREKAADAVARGLGVIDGLQVGSSVPHPILKWFSLAKGLPAAASDPNATPASRLSSFTTWVTTNRSRMQNIATGNVDVALLVTGAGFPEGAEAALVGSVCTTQPTALVNIGPWSTTA